MHLKITDIFYGQHNKRGSIKAKNNSKRVVKTCSTIRTTQASKFVRNDIIVSMYYHCLKERITAIMKI